MQAIRSVSCHLLVLVASWLGLQPSAAGAQAPAAPVWTAPSTEPPPAAAAPAPVEAEVPAEPEPVPPPAAEAPPAVGPAVPPPEPSAEPPVAGHTEDEWGESAADSAGFAPPPVVPPPSAAAAASPAAEPGELSATIGLSVRGALWSERLTDEPFAQARSAADLGLRYKKPFQLFSEASVFRLVAEAHVEYDFAYLYDPERFDEPTLEAYQHQIIGRETYAGLSIGALELAFGRQIITWGQGETISPADIINPRDVREPGLVELDAMRMAVLASRAGLSFGPHRIDALLVHEAFFGLRPAPLSDFSPLRAILLRNPEVAAVLETKNLRYEDVPERFDAGTPQFYLRWSYAGEGLDLALYAASTLDKQGSLTLPDPADYANSDLELGLWHPRYAMFGHSGAKPIGSFVLRWELVFDYDRPLSVSERDDPLVPVDWLRRHRFTGLLGATYTGLRDTRIALEYAQSLLLDNPARDEALGLQPFWPVERPVIALRVVRTFLREQLQLTLVGTLIGISPFIGALGRAELAYNLAEALSVGIGYAAYAASSDDFGPFYGFTQNDRLYATLRWDVLLD